ncbi:hypothetical protein MHYP_G00177090 [Metynnis hypsauchen]
MAYFLDVEQLALHCDFRPGRIRKESFIKASRAAVKAEASASVYLWARGVRVTQQELLGEQRSIHPQTIHHVHFLFAQAGRPLGSAAERTRAVSDNKECSAGIAGAYQK